ncbi:MAG: hypothetical protein IK127_02690 [Clostridia bacterium]|nr:hypothetical protein [Clostridia bacterium]
MLRQALICAALLAFVLALPLLAPGSIGWLIPAFFLAPIAPWLCVRLNRRAVSHRDWESNADHLDADRIDTVCIEPSLLIGRRWLQAEIWLPFERVGGERFRSQKGAMALSAAVALTDECVQNENSAEGFSAQDISEWEQALGISSRNFKLRNPRMDDARYCGFPGVIVLDGKSLRAYFVGGPALLTECRRVLDGTERNLTTDDRERLRDIPSRALCYATALLIDGHLQEVCYIGSVLPVARYGVSPDALAAGQRLHRMGIHVTLDTQDTWALENARAMGVEWPEDDGRTGVLHLRGVHPDTEQPHEFDRPVLALIRASRQERYHRLLCGLFGLMLWPCATLSREPWPFLIALLCLCLTILITRDQVFPPPPRYGPRSFLAPLAPGVLLPLIIWFFIEYIAKGDSTTAGAYMIISEAIVFSIWRVSLLLGQPGGFRTLLLGSLICLIAFSAIVLLTTNGTWISASFGSVAGVLVAVAVIVGHRVLGMEKVQG